MIKLTRPKKPDELTEAKITELTDIFKKNENKSVWRKGYIINALIKMSNSKCAYCECKLQEESKYMTVDHFHPKHKYKDEVVSWKNLLPCCNGCNTNKNELDTYAIPIIDPSKDDPREYLYIQNARYRSLNDNIMGNRTINILKLNDTQRFGAILIALRRGIHDKFKANYLIVRKITSKEMDVEESDFCIKQIKDVLKLTTQKEAYSAFRSSFILESHEDNRYYDLKQKMIDKGLWDDELSELEQSVRKISFLET